MTQNKAVCHVRDGRNVFRDYKNKKDYERDNFKYFVLGNKVYITLKIPLSHANFIQFKIWFFQSDLHEFNEYVKYF